MILLNAFLLHLLSVIREKMYKNFFSFIILLFAFQTSEFNAQNLIWSQTYGGIWPDGAHDVKTTADGGFIIAGFSGSYAFAGGPYDVYLIKTDASGNMTWWKTFGCPMNDIAASVIQTNDGGYMLAGRREITPQIYDAYLIRTDASGNLLWEQMYDEGNDDRFHSVIQTSDGGFIAAGQAWFGDIMTGNYDIYVVKTDQSGNVQWSQTYAYTFYGNDVALSIQEVSSGGYIIGGVTQSSIWAAYLIRTDNLGNIIWSNTYQVYTQAECNSVKELPDGGFIFTGDATSPGQTDSDVYLVKIDSSGNVIWQKTIGGSGTFQAEDVGQSVLPLPDGGIIVAGHTSSFGAGSWDAYVIRIDENGDTLWTRTFGGDNDDRAFAAELTANNNIIIAGWTWSFGANVYLFKLSDALIPVELLSFNAAVNGSDVLLEWITASETNNQGFEIHRIKSGVRSQSGRTPLEESEWKAIGFVDGNGTTTETKSYSYVDKNLKPGKYSYRLKQIDFDGSFEYLPSGQSASNEIEVEILAPAEFILEQNYPNPFNPVTVISFQLPVKNYVTLKIFNSLGQEVVTLVDEHKSEGRYEVEFNASQLPSGIYFYNLRSDAFSETKKVVLIK